MKFAACLILAVGAMAAEKAEEKFVDMVDATENDCLFPENSGAAYKTDNESCSAMYFNLCDKIKLPPKTAC